MNMLSAIGVKISRQFYVLCTYMRWKIFVCHLGKRSVIKRTLLVNSSKSISVGKFTTIEKDAVLADLLDGRGARPKIIIGDYCTILFRFHCNAAISVKIGNNVLMASNVFITDSDHIVEVDELPVTMNNKFISSPVAIGNNCWIGQNAVILKGVVIGDNSIVGASSVVTKSVPPCSVVCGNPARIVRSLRSNEN